MIKTFFYDTYIGCDLLTGYNSDRFDWFFLITRYNILKSKSTTNFIETIGYQNSVRLFYDKSISPFLTQISLHTTLSISRRCPNCADLIPSTSNAFKYGFCGCLTNQDTSNANNTKDLVINQITTKFNNNTMPFCLDFDLINDAAVTKDCMNKKLETVCAHMFMIQLDNINTLLNDHPHIHTDKVYEVQLKADLSKTKWTEFIQLFRPNIKVNIISYHGISKHFDVVCVGRIVSRTQGCDSSKRVYITINNCAVSSIEVLNQLKSDIGLTNSSIYITVGKTSQLSLYDQLFWTKPEHMYDTITYCIVDTLITMFLEVYTLRIPKILNTELYKTSMRNVLNWPVGKLSMHILFH